LDAAKLQYSYAVILAPQNGHIAKKNLEVGQLMSPNQPVMSIVMDERVWVVANFKETQLDDIKAGQAVKVDVDAYPDHVFHGKVNTIQYATGSRFSLLPPDNASGNFTKVVQRVPVRIEIDPADVVGYRLLPGMSVAVAVDIHSGAIVK
jgi:membrane fusion protein (multidrug efflux system)